ncbi:N-formylglutamate deformylase [Usitatibacter palustris]|nr:N-formylglutamate deformylase [Usitatibacter palustris]
MKSAVPPYLFRRGGGALIVSLPHVSTYVPPTIANRHTEAAAQRPDTDWHLPRLYDFLAELDATVITATHSRYVVDLNRPPDDVSLYPGRVTTGLCPLETFHGAPVYLENCAPDSAEIAQRVERYWKPYHQRLAAELARIRAQHGVAMLWDAHSIVSEAPRLFEGRLPDFNLGTADGKSCDASLATDLEAILHKHHGFTSVHNGRFKGGYITRHYGQPANGIHAVQMEMACSTYMQETLPYSFDNVGASRVRHVLRELFDRLIEFTKKDKTQ